MNAEVQTMVAQVVGDYFSTFLDENPLLAKLSYKMSASARARCGQKARDLVIRKSALESMTLPGKLAIARARSRKNRTLHR